MVHEDHEDHEDKAPLVALMVGCPRRLVRRAHYEPPEEGPDTELDVRADLNCEDDDGLNWALLVKAVHPERVEPGAVLRAGTERSWSWVRVVAVDEDGQVHFQQVSGAEAAKSGRLATAR